MKIKRLLAAEIAQRQVRMKYYVPPVDYPPEEAICLGEHPVTGERVWIRMKNLNGPSFIHGAMGTGKSTVFENVGLQAISKKAGIDYFCAKNQGLWYSNLIPNSGIFNACELPVRWLVPPDEADPITHLVGFAVAFGKMNKLRESVTNKILELLHRWWLEGRFTEGFSLTDFRDNLEHEYQRDKILIEAVIAARALCILFGRAAAIRQAPDDLESRFDLLVIEIGGLSSAVVEFILELYFQRYLALALKKGHTRDLQRLFYIDEGHLVYGRELVVKFGSGHVTPQIKFCTQIGATGRGLAVSNQSIWNTEPAFKANVANTFSLRIAGAKDLEEVAAMHGLSQEEATQLLSLPKGVGLVKSEGWEKSAWVRFFDVDKGPFPSPQKIQQKIDAQWARLASEIVYAPPSLPQTVDLQKGCVKPTSSSKTHGFVGDAEILMQGIINHPGVGCVDLYDLIHFTRTRGTAVKKALIAKGWIQETQVPSGAGGGRPTMVLSLTDDGKKYMKDGI